MGCTVCLGNPSYTIQEYRKDNCIVLLKMRGSAVPEVRLSGHLKTSTITSKLLAQTSLSATLLKKIGTTTKMIPQTTLIIGK
ncbi:hypothetical protein KEM48_008649 [Puccinia striiformis f. sp. tritici PST-130]|nr:hypothetical protein KEM48_008649 [Puccinia striiformis f. sp. tritici PST-130]